MRHDLLFLNRNFKSHEIEIMLDWRLGLKSWKIRCWPSPKICEKQKWEIENVSVCCRLGRKKRKSLASSCPYFTDTILNQTFLISKLKIFQILIWFKAVQIILVARVPQIAKVIKFSVSCWRSLVIRPPFIGDTNKQSVSLLEEI